MGGHLSTGSGDPDVGDHLPSPFGGHEARECPVALSPTSSSRCSRSQTLIGADPPRIAVARPQVRRVVRRRPTPKARAAASGLKCAATDPSIGPIAVALWPSAAEETSGSDQSALRSTPALSRAADEPREAAGVVAEDRSARCVWNANGTRRGEEGWAPFPGQSFVVDGVGSKLGDRLRTAKAYTWSKRLSWTAFAAGIAQLSGAVPWSRASGAKIGFLESDRPDGLPAGDPCGDFRAACVPRSEPESRAISAWSWSRRG
jgi:hypothetical protein